MKCLFALASAAMLAAPSAPAETVKTGPGTEHFGGWPPERYSGEFAAVVAFVYDPTEYCGVPPEGLIRLGCAWTREDGVPVIVVLHPNYFPNETFARIVAHEIAHGRGWPGDHPL